MTSHAVILAGGLGTRLGGLTANTPKPMLPVAGQPFIDLLIGHLSREGVTSVTILAGYLGDQIAKYFDKNPVASVDIDVLIESEPLGTGGALKFAAAHLPESFFLLNGDTFFDVPLADLSAYKHDSAAHLACIAMRYVDDTGRYGQIRREGTNVIDFAARAETIGSPGWINGGVYLLKRGILDFIGDGFVSLEHDVFPRLVTLGLMTANPYDVAFIDIGVVSEYETAQTFLPDTLRRPALFLDRDGVLNRDIGYLHRIDQFEWIPGALDVIKFACARRWFVFVVTNQGGVGRGFYKEEDVIALHRWILQQVQQVGGHITDFRYCPHHPEAVSDTYKTPCSWRKPSPGMLMDLLERYPIDVTSSLMVGDNDADIAAADAAGIASLKYTNGRVDDLVAPHLERSRKE